MSQEEAIWNPQHPDYSRKKFISEKWDSIANQLEVKRKHRDLHDYVFQFLNLLVQLCIISSHIPFYRRPSQKQI